LLTIGLLREIHASSNIVSVYIQDQHRKRSKKRLSCESGTSAGGGTVNRINFWSEETGQDLIEYTLLLSMVCLASAALMIGSGDAVSTIWHTTNNSLSSANSMAAPR
jgi:Flp pilus assembly pilin Flp